MMYESRLISGGAYHGYDGFCTFTHFKCKLIGGRRLGKNIADWQLHCRSHTCMSPRLPYSSLDALRAVVAVPLRTPLTRSFEPLMSLRYPPLTSTSKYILTLLLASPLPNRPKSVEDEERRLWWRKWRGTIIVVLGLVLVGTVGGGFAGIKQKLLQWRD